MSDEKVLTKENAEQFVADETRGTSGIKNLCILLVLMVLFVSSGGCGSSTSSEPDDFSLKYTGRQRLKNSLRDPASLEIIEERLVRPGRDGAEVGYYAKFRAKNGFGGYNVDEYYTE